jgi:hypothetical protein
MNERKDNAYNGKRRRRRVKKIISLTEKNGNRKSSVTLSILNACISVFKVLRRFNME